MARARSSLRPPRGPMARRAISATFQFTPEMPMRLSPAAPMVPATCEPCQRSSPLRAGDGSPRLPTKSYPFTSSMYPSPSSSRPLAAISEGLIQRLGARSGCVSATPSSTTATVIRRSPTVDAQAPPASMAVSPHSSLKRGSLGARPWRYRYTGSANSTPGRRAASRANATGSSPGGNGSRNRAGASEGPSACKGMMGAPSLLAAAKDGGSASRSSWTRIESGACCGSGGGPPHASTTSAIAAAARAAARLARRGRMRSACGISTSAASRSGSSGARRSIHPVDPAEESGLSATLQVLCMSPPLEGDGPLLAAAGGDCRRRAAPCSFAQYASRGVSFSDPPLVLRQVARAAAAGHSKERGSGRVGSRKLPPVDRRGPGVARARRPGSEAHGGAGASRLGSQGQVARPGRGGRGQFSAHRVPGRGVASVPPAMRARQRRQIPGEARAGPATRACAGGGRAAGLGSGADELIGPGQRRVELRGIAAAGLGQLGLAAAAAAQRLRKLLDQIAGLELLRQIWRDGDQQRRLPVLLASQHHDAALQLVAKLVGQLAQALRVAVLVACREHLDAVHLAGPLGQLAALCGRRLLRELFHLALQLPYP